MLFSIFFPLSFFTLMFSIIRDTVVDITQEINLCMCSTIVLKDILLNMNKFIMITQLTLHEQNHFSVCFLQTLDESKGEP